MRRKGDGVKEEKLEKRLKINKEERKHKKSHSRRATEIAVQEEKG